VSNALVVDGLWKGYHVGVRGCSVRVRVLRGVTFCVATGERVGIVGAAGAGKTTLSHCIAGLRRPDAGRLALAGALDDTLLLLDEPGLDDARRRTQPASALLFARDAGRLRGRVDRVLELVDGRIRPARDAFEARVATREAARQVAEPAAPLVGGLVR
jgi:ABC-type cobalamin/Fe3+-siderophores transport system ATPase subunit